MSPFLRDVTLLIDRPYVKVYHGIFYQWHCVCLHPKDECSHRIFDVSTGNPHRKPWKHHDAYWSRKTWKCISQKWIFISEFYGQIINVCNRRQEESIPNDFLNQLYIYIYTEVTCMTCCIQIYQLAVFVVLGKLTIFLIMV